MLEIILTSSLTAGIVSGVVTYLVNVSNQKAAIKEKLFHMAFDLAKYKTDLVLKIAMENKSPADLTDALHVAEGYLQELNHLYEKGELSSKMKKLDSRFKL